MEIGFYLLHLPWHVLIEEAERLRLKVPLKVIAKIIFLKTPKIKKISTIEIETKS